MASVAWDRLARAVSFRLEWERLCGRSNLISENSLKQAICEYLQAETTLVIKPEHNHPDLKEARRLDVVGFGPQEKKIDVACEAKWVKDTGGTRDIHAEVANDILRLECLRIDMAQQTERALIIGGYYEPMEREFYGKRKRVGPNQMTPWIRAILPSSISPGYEKIEIEASQSTFRPFFKNRASDTLTGKLPKSLHARKIVMHTADPSDNQSIRCDIWLIRSVPNRAMFSPP